MTIRIKYANECYEVYYNQDCIACQYHDSSISNHVQNIIEILVACNVECVLEEEL